MILSSYFKDKNVFPTFLHYTDIVLWVGQCSIKCVPTVFLAVTSLPPFPLTTHWHQDSFLPVWSPVCILPLDPQASYPMDISSSRPVQNRLPPSLPVSLTLQHLMIWITDAHKTHVHSVGEGGGIFVTVSGVQLLCIVYWYGPPVPQSSNWLFRFYVPSNAGNNNTIQIPILKSCSIRQFSSLINSAFCFQVCQVSSTLP